MGYRKPDHRPPKMEATNTPTEVFVNNWATTSLAFPCWYVSDPEHPHHECCCRDHHDHIGWPNPDSPDDSCQIPHIHTNHHHHLAELTPIHLHEEGYVQVLVSVGGDHLIDAYGWIDSKCDWIVRVSLTPEAEDLVEPSVVPMTVYIVHENGSREVLANSTLHILPTVKPENHDLQ